MKIFCSGIGGIGLSAYASLQAHRGHTVMGSDRARTPLTDALGDLGIEVLEDQSGAALPNDVDLLVYSEAIPQTAPERVRARELGIPQQSYSEAVGALANGSRLIAVCGTHGKSSTTAMTARLLMGSGFDPTVVVGTKMKERDGKNWRAGKSGWFVLEACEYRRSFHFYNPQIILLTNADGDHFDYYKSKDDYRRAFVDFVRKLPVDGLLITHLSDPDCRSITQAAGRPVLDADSFPFISLGTPGLHMRQNAQLVLALAQHLGIASEESKKIVSRYGGSWRRIEIKGTRSDGVTVIDDYAHHPREIRATVAAVKDQFPVRRLVCVFQPHTHDRTFKLYEDFLECFAGVDRLIVTNVYDARSDGETRHVDGAKFSEDIAARGRIHTTFGRSLGETERMLRTEILELGDILLCLGAGDITNLATEMVE
ncbi:UDP-N-acetylmuramate--L-alanine ligase [Candidatus Peregrinibacteria bacterium]|nr:UDP-N-acetylmuramate--L-alanine ligase [Candidatus Peregrinibacteria bacterium]MBI3816815.1 UDP-N-acetylmuramate--L-alanine ligase [Candidatus Peregrinibacteria bacterium]